jgi:glycine cleavage system H protein
MPSPNDRRYSKEHEWLKQEGELAYIGITDYAQEQLGDVVYVDLPEVGSQVIQYEKMGEIESVKAVSELYAPASGEVVMVNDEVMQKPELVNTDPHEAGWLLQIKLTRTLELNGLMSAQDYDDFTATESKDEAVGP